MKEELLLILSIIGIIVIMLFAYFLKPVKIEIKEISQSDLNKLVKINGKIAGLREYPKENFQVFTIKDKTGNITGIANSNKHINLDDRNYEIIGRIKESKTGNLQISVETIKFLN